MRGKLLIPWMIVLSAIIGLSANGGLLLRDTFDGTSVDANWSKYLNAPMSVSDGKVTMTPPGTVAGQRAFILRDTDDDGNTTLGSAAVYNFYDHELRASVRCDNLLGSSSAGYVSYFVGIGSSANDYEVNPLHAQNGVFVEIREPAGSANFSAYVTEKVGGVATTTSLGLLVGEPDGIDLTVSSNTWVISLTGAKFFTGQTSRETGTFTAISESDFSAFKLAAGLVQSGAMSEQASMEISLISVATPDADMVCLLDAPFDTGTGATPAQLDDEGWTRDLNATMVYRDGKVQMSPPGTVSSQRAYISRLTDTAGSATNVSGTAVYNFFDHRLDMSVEWLAMDGTPSAWIPFFIGISKYDAGTSDHLYLSPGFAKDGIFFCIQKQSAGNYYLQITEKVNGARTDTAVGGFLSSRPEMIEVSLDGTNWTATVVGATFTGASSPFYGLSVATGNVVSALSEADFDNTFYLSVGCENQGTVTEQASAEIGSVTVFTPVAGEEAPYDTWTAAYALSGSDAELTADPDGDGWNNLAEYALGGNPTNPAASGYAAVSDVQNADGTNWFEYVHFERADKESRGLSYTPEQTAALTETNWLTTGFVSVGSGAYNADFNVVTNRVEIDGQAARFIHLKIEQQ